MNTEALARVLCSADGLDPDAHERGAGPLWEGYVEDARRILADPAPLLAALAEAGILREEHSALFEGEYGGKWHVAFGHQPSRVPLRRYVSDWTEVQP